MPIPLFSGFSLKNGDKADDGDNDDDIIHDAETYEDACFNDTDYEGSSAEPMLFDQNELSDLIRDLSLSKESAELLASSRKENNLLTSETRVTFYCNRDAEFIPLFNEEPTLFIAVMLKEFWCALVFKNTMRIHGDCSSTAQSVA